MPEAASKVLEMGSIELQDAFNCAPAIILVVERARPAGRKSDRNRGEERIAKAGRKTGQNSNEVLRDGPHKDTDADQDSRLSKAQPPYFGGHVIGRSVQTRGSCFAPTAREQALKRQVPDTETSF
jgi:general stress protein YciG